MNQVSQPNQPKSISRTATRKQGNQNRTVCSSSWFTDHSWLSFCESRGNVFCYYKLCYFQYEVRSGFHNKGLWQLEACQARFRNHESAHAHHESVLNCAAAAEKCSIAVQLQSQMQKVQNFRREMLFKQLSSMKFLLRQGLAIRGHHDEEGNFHQLLTCWSEDVKELVKRWQVSLSWHQ